MIKQRLVYELIKKVINFYFYLEHCYYRGFYICHRDEFKNVIFELEGIDIDYDSILYKEV